MSALLRTFFPPWESKVAAMETLDGMPCAPLTGAAFKHIYIYNINTYACTRAKISILFWLYTYLLMKYTKALASCAAQLRWRRRRLRSAESGNMAGLCFHARQMADMMVY